MKSFDGWNEIKKTVNYKTTNFHIVGREIRYAHLWVNVGCEEDGKWNEYKRPVIVLKKIGNMFAIVPMTTWWNDSRYYYRLSNNYFWKTSRVILSQIRVLDKARFIDKIWMLSKEDLLAIKEKLKALLL